MAATRLARTTEAIARIQGQVGAIGHQAIDAHVDQAAHVGRIVHRPHVHLDAVPVCGLDQPGCHDLQVALSLGYLERIHALQCAADQPG